jgi:hypothetical protein
VVPALVGNHIADILRHTTRRFPAELREYVGDRDQYDYRQHTRQGRTTTPTSDEIVRLHGSRHVTNARNGPRAESLGVTEYDIYTTIPEPST